MFESQTATDDGAGGRTMAWAAVSGAPTKCHFKQSGGSEAWRDERLNAQARAKVVVRYNSSITEKMRVTIGGKAHQIRSIDNVEQKSRWLEIAVERGVAT